MLWPALLFLLLWGLGFYLVRWIWQVDDPWLAVSWAGPVAWLLLIGVCSVLAWIVPYEVIVRVLPWLCLGGWVLLWRRRECLVPLQSFSLSYSAGIGVGCCVLAGAFYIHTTELLNPPDDYWIHYPLIALLGRGIQPPPNPFFPDLVLHGHFGRDYLLALVGTATGRDYLATLWFFNHLAQFNAASLAFALGRRYGRGEAGGVLLCGILFFGISVGSRVGLVDTYDNNNMLVYVVLLALLGILCFSLESGGIDLSARPLAWLMWGVLCGIYEVVYETHMVLLVLCLVWVPLIRGGFRYREQGFVNWKALLTDGLGAGLVVVTALSVAVMLGGPLQDLVGRAKARRPVSLVEAYESQRVQIVFPKRRLGQILLGEDRYRRLSYVYEGRLFRPLRQLAFSPGGYTFVWHPKVLIIHWLALYLGVLVVFPLGKQRNMFGLLCWVFAALAYLVPAVVGFGPVHEKEYFRWEFAAGFGFAAALAVTLSYAWKAAEGRRGIKAGLVLLVILVCWGGERRLNETVIALQKVPSVRRARLLRPWYPSADTWLLETPRLAVTKDDLRLSRRLYKLLTSNSRVLTDVTARSNYEIFRESTLMGLWGARSVAHLPPPPWAPDGIAPYFRTPAWVVFWQRLDTRVLPYMGVDYIYATGTQKTIGELISGLAKSKGVVLITDQAEKRRAIFKSVRAHHTPRQPPAGVEVEGVQLPDERTLQSEVSYPVTVNLVNRGERFIRWTGPLEIELSPQHEGSRRSVYREPPLRFRVELRLAPGGKQRVSLWLVPPLVEGKYQVRFRLGGKVLSGPDLVLDYNLSGWLKRLQVEDELLSDTMQGRERKLIGRLHIRAEQAISVAGPLFVGWRVWDGREKRYQTPFGFVGKREFHLKVSPGDEQLILYEAALPADRRRFRLDFFIRSWSGLEVPLDRTQRKK